MHNELITTGNDDGDTAGRARRLRQEARGALVRDGGAGGRAGSLSPRSSPAAGPPAARKVASPAVPPRRRGSSRAFATDGRSRQLQFVALAQTRVLHALCKTAPNPCGRGLGTLFQRGSSPPKHQDWPCAQPRSAAVLGRGLRGEAPELRLRAPRPPPLTGVVAGHPRVPVGRGGFADSVSPAPCMVVSPLAGWEVFLHDGPSVPSRGRPVPHAAA